MEKKELIRYWLESSDRDYSAMIHLYRKKDHNWSLFIGHLVIEKLLKAYYVSTVDNNPPNIHNLLRLAEKTDLKISEDQKDFLITVTSFNIRARYDDFKQEFLKTCNSAFTKIYIEQIKEFRKWIKKQHLTL